MAAKGGLPDQDHNPALKITIQRKKKMYLVMLNRAQKPKVEMLILILQRYEGFGPNNSLFIVECLTDNPIVHILK